MDIAIFCLLMLVIVSPTYTLEGNNICLKTGKNESVELVCCNDYEEKNNKCVECSPGFRGRNCTDKCQENYYGRKCLTECSCNEMQICHPVCGCLQRMDLDISNMTKNGTGIFSENVTYSPFAEECPTTKDVLSTTTGLMYKTATFSHSVFGIHSLDSNSRIPFLIGATSVTERCVHHNMVYDLEDTSRIQENPSVHEEPTEPLYGECSYEDTCYSSLILRVNNESGREPNTSRQPVFTDDDNIYEFAYRYSHHSDEGQPPNVYITGMTEAAE